jgi:hypothetical protein
LQKFGLDSSEDLTFGLICIMLLDFMYLFAASTLLGMMYGLVTAYCLRSFHFHHVSQVQTVAAGGPSGRHRACSSLRGRAFQPPALHLLPGAPAILLPLRRRLR